jgi:type VI protein secretion system component Hcp
MNNALRPGRRYTMFQMSLLLKLPGITGTARQSGHVGEIELTDLQVYPPRPRPGNSLARGSQVPPVPVSKGAGSSYSYGPAVLRIFKRFDNATNALSRAYVTGTAFNEAVLTVLTLGDNKEVAQYRFKYLFMNSPDEHISFDKEANGPVQVLEFDYASVVVRQEAGTPPMSGLPLPVRFLFGERYLGSYPRNPGPSGPSVITILP